ncbi:MAG: hypothetical protein ACI3ZN_01470 [Candidatus Cryptobacteroides sp.]
MIESGRIFAVALLLAAALLSISGCVDFSRVKVGDVVVTRINPKGMRSIDLTLEAKVDNGSREFSLSEIEGIVYYDGAPVCSFTMDDVTVLRKTSDTYSVNGNVTLGQGMSMLSLLPLLRSFDSSACKADISLKVKPKGTAGRKITLKDVSLEKFLNEKSIGKKTEKWI